MILDRCLSLEKDIQNDRRQMQTIIDAKQRLIEKQVKYKIVIRKIRKFYAGKFMLSLRTTPSIIY